MVGQGRDEIFHFFCTIDNTAFKIGKVPQCAKPELFICKRENWDRSGVEMWLYEVLSGDYTLGCHLSETSHLELFEGGWGPYRKSDLFQQYRLKKGESRVDIGRFGAQLRTILRSQPKNPDRLLRDNKTFICFAPLQQLQERFA